jgi:RNA polymerase sigma-B factor
MIFDPVFLRPAMLVNLICRPLSRISHLSRRDVTFLADALRDTGAAVVEDVWVSPSIDMDTALTAGAFELRERWAEQPPDVVHTVGIVATMTAIKAGGPAPIVATFDEMPANAGLEKELARAVSAVIPLSRAERERWRRHGVRTLSVGTFPIPMPIPDVDACALVGGDVISLSGDGSLDCLVASMALWAPVRLVMAARLSPARLTGVRRTAEALGVLDRIDYRPGLRGLDREAMWAGASVVVAGVDGSRHGGHVLEAAAHGIPSIAVARDAHLDHIVPRTTGILVDPTIDSRGLGQAVALVLGDSFWVRAMGMSALALVRAQHAPSFAGQRLMSLYREAVDAPSPVPQSAGLPMAEACVGCPESCAHCPRHPGVVDLAGRNALALDNLPLARQLAGWYAGRGQSTEDLVQVASLGLVHAAERFDPSQGKEFHSFAIPTILGELRRHFRDQAWAVRVPRTLQETTLHVLRATQELRQTLGHEASVADLADELDLDPQEVLNAQRADTEAHTTQSLDQPLGDSRTTLADLFGEPDPRLHLVEAHSGVRAALGELPAREQQILLMRFYGERTQSEIAERLGISQVHVSRVLTRTLAAIRDHILDDVPLPEGLDPPKTAPAIPRPRLRPTPPVR